MISPKEIQEQCLKWWKDVLISSISSNDCVDIFPKQISRIGKVSSKYILNNINEYKESIELLKKSAKENTKFGYSLVLEERNFDKIGRQTVPIQIGIECIKDYLAITKKEKEYQTFCNNYSLIIRQLPLLKEWIIENPIRLIEHNNWVDTLKVCQCFLANPKPNLYIRQLPIDIHTKYIEENKSIITSLLNFIIPNEINKDEKDFEQRFNLLSKQQLIRIRFLDQTKSPLQNITDISFTESEFKHYNFTVENVFITENLMNFLTLPVIANTIGIWSGGGFSISYLKNIEWLKDK